MLQYSKSRQSIWKNNLCKILKCHHFLIEPETTNYKFIVFNNRCSYYDNQHTLFLSNQRSAIKWCILWPAVIILPHPGENKEVFNTFQDLNWLFETQKDHFDFFFSLKGENIKHQSCHPAKKFSISFLVRCRQQFLLDCWGLECRKSGLQQPCCAPEMELMNSMELQPWLWAFSMDPYLETTVQGFKLKLLFQVILLCLIKKGKRDIRYFFIRGKNEDEPKFWVRTTNFPFEV